MVHCISVQKVQEHIMNLLGKITKIQKHIKNLINPKKTHIINTKNKDRKIIMKRQDELERRNDFSIYGVFRFASYLLASVAMYLGNLQIAGIAFGFGATLGFVRRLARLWE